MDIREQMILKAEAAKRAADAMTMVSTVVKNKALLAMADRLEAESSRIIEANKADLENASADCISSRSCW